jgi:hypothetical protein
MSSRPQPALREYRGWGGVSTSSLDEPVIVLTAARCGSTLLRSLLDAHPDLACPPETNVVKVCAQLAAIFSLVDGSSPASDGRLPTAADGKIRDAFAAVFADYLARRGKRRWCDKSLGTAPVADWFAGLYPRAKFICLYRHCIDVIHSGLEASPWGLMGYGFEQFAGRVGGNNVSALAAYWADHTSRILQFERAHGGRCVRVHYERLVGEPERTAAEIFTFLGVEQVPGISELCFATAHEEASRPGLLGPGDHKIRATTGITAGSVGRGVRIPVELIPPAQLKAVNLLLAELGYTQLDEAWRASPCPPPLLAEDGTAGAASPGPAGAQPDGQPHSFGDEIMRTVLANIGEYIAARIIASFRQGLPSVLIGDSSGGTRFGLVAYHADGQRLARGWQVNIGERSVSEVSIGDGARIDADWLVTGDVETWLGVLAGRANMASCLRNGALRYVGTRDREPDPDGVPNAALTAAMETERRLTTARELLGLAGRPEDGTA